MMDTGDKIIDELKRDIYTSDDSLSRTLLWKWLLESENDAESDEILKELQRETAPDSDSDALAAFARMSDSLKLSHRPRTGLVRVVSVVCCLLLSVLVTAFYYENRCSGISSLVEVSTEVGESREITLPDGSIMTLGPLSRLIYPERFSRRDRRVFFSGEAYADIVHLKNDAPFILSLDNIDVVVTGTEFKVDSYPRYEQTAVSLVDGSLYVRKKNEDQGLYLSSGQMVTYHKDMSKFVRSDFDAASFRYNVCNGALLYFNTSLSDIAVSLENHFGVKVYIDDASLASQTYYASFINGEDADSILSTLNADKVFKITKNNNVYHLSY